MRLLIGAGSDLANVCEPTTHNLNITTMDCLRGAVFLNEQQKSKNPQMSTTF